MFEEFEKGVSLRELITEILRDGNASITQVGGRLKERGIKIHRLALAGYLKALSDDGYLEEREIPPAKTYRLSSGHAPRNVYAVVVEKVRAFTSDEGEANRLLVHVLGELFHRPIFREEIRRAGQEPGRGLEEIDGEERQAARRSLSRSPLKLPFNDPAFRPKTLGPEDEAHLRNLGRQVLSAALRDQFGVQSYALVAKQATLKEGD